MANTSFAIVTIVAALVGLIHCRPDVLEPVVAVRSSDPLGNLPYARSSTSNLKNVDGQDVLVQQGSFSFDDDQGRNAEVNYNADEFGYHARFVITSNGQVIPVNRVAVFDAVQPANIPVLSSAVISSSPVVNDVPVLPQIIAN